MGESLPSCGKLNEKSRCELNNVNKSTRHGTIIKNICPTTRYKTSLTHHVVLLHDFRLSTCLVRLSVNVHVVCEHLCMCLSGTPSASTLAGLRFASTAASRTTATTAVRVTTVSNDMCRWTSDHATSMSHRQQEHCDPKKQHASSFACPNTARTTAAASVEAQQCQQTNKARHNHQKHLSYNEIKVSCICSISQRISSSFFSRSMYVTEVHVLLGAPGRHKFRQP